MLHDSHLTATSGVIFKGIEVLGNPEVDKVVRIPGLSQLFIVGALLLEGVVHGHLVHPGLDDGPRGYSVASSIESSWWT